MFTYLTGHTGVMNKIIMRSECLREVFTDLDVTSEMLEILMSPDVPYFRVSTFGTYGTSQVRSTSIMDWLMVV